MKLQEIVTHINRSLRGKMTTAEFMRALGDEEYKKLLAGDGLDKDPTSLHDLVVMFVKKHYPAITIEDEEDVPNHAKEYNIVHDDETSTGWKKNADSLRRVK